MHHHSRRTGPAGRIARGIAYTCGAAAFAALTHRWNAEAATSLAIAIGVLAAILGFLPRAVAKHQRADLEQLIDEKFAVLSDNLAEDVNTALRHAVEIGVQDGALRRGLQRTAGEPPRPRRLHAVPRNRESI